MKRKMNNLLPQQRRELRLWAKWVLTNISSADERTRAITTNNSLSDITREGMEQAYELAGRNF